MAILTDSHYFFNKKEGCLKMKKPSVVLNDTVIILPDPKIKLWRIMADYRTNIKVASQDLLDNWEKIEAIKGKKDKESLKIFNKLLTGISQKSDELEEHQIRMKLEIIKQAFGIDNVDDLDIAIVPKLFDEVDTYVSLVISGKADLIPNAEGLKENE